MIIENFSASEFFGTAIVLSLIVSITIVFFEGLGIFRDIFSKTGEEKNFFHHHFHYKDRR